MIPFTQVMFRGVDYVVDVANVTGDLRKERIVLVSTKLTLHHKMEHGGARERGHALDRVDVPTTHPSGRTTGKKSPRCTRYSQRDWTGRRGRAACSTRAAPDVDEAFLVRARRPAHRAFARRHGLGIITNDRRLARDAHLSLPKAGDL